MPSERMANILARKLRREGWLVRITSGGRPVFYEIWSRLPKR